MLADFPERALLADEDGVTPLGRSIALRDEELTTAIITSAQMEGAIGRLLTQRSQGHLPLHAATLTGDSTIISALLIANASASAVDGEGRLPLHLAARMGSFDACDLLVERMQHARRHVLRSGSGGGHGWDARRGPRIGRFRDAPHRDGRSAG